MKLRYAIFWSAKNRSGLLITVPLVTDSRYFRVQKNVAALDMPPGVVQEFQYSS